MGDDKTPLDWLEESLIPPETMSMSKDLKKAMDILIHELDAGSITLKDINKFIMDNKRNIQ